MKKREILAGVTFIFSVVLSTTAFGIENEDDFCSEPYLAVCGVDDWRGNLRDIEFATLKKDIKAQALSDTAIKFGEDPNKYLVPKSIKAVFYYVKRISEITQYKVTDVELNAVLRNIRKIKEYLKDAIVEQAFNNAISFEQSEKLRKVIDSVDIDTKYELENPSFDFTSSLRYEVFKRICGNDGLSENAFASSDIVGRHVIVCPGWLLRAHGGGEDDESNFNNIVSVIAHELAHHIDYGEFPEIYTEMNSCIAKNHADDLRLGQVWFETALATIPKGFRGYWNDLKVHNHGSEMSADFWSAQVLRLHLQTVDYEKRLETLREAWVGLCGSGDEGIHPSGQFRLRVQLRSDPEIHKLMECAPAADVHQIGCTLSGAAYENLDY